MIENYECNTETNESCSKHLSACGFQMCISNIYTNASHEFLSFLLLLRINTRQTTANPEHHSFWTYCARNANIVLTYFTYISYITATQLGEQTASAAIV